MNDMVHMNVSTSRLIVTTLIAGFVGGLTAAVVEMIVDSMLLT